jgi:type III secretion HrpO family protein
LPSIPALTELGENAILLSLAVSLPVIGVAALVGGLVSAVQAATQLQDPTLAHLPRLLAVALVLVLAGPWMGGQIAEFAQSVLTVR